jgi:hypothetical protein
MKTIFVVVGSVGEYSDRREWCARAFPTEAAAQDFIQAVHRAHAMADHPNTDKWTNDLDPYFRHGYYDQASYRIEDVPWSE